ncbi:related to protein tyrosine phosphatase phi [Cephalotrichum gorgonifer]|uniref:Related to protein tyrosine phosphatase phi n=1 Tax=Cephalotrichum gorgonifer TaxID=2041049 RepID=A0AAE8SX41_9PEZI|nr:related to protein tyrosine phosphatase phi [Cephalotrichum gorgonifer]
MDRMPRFRRRPKHPTIKTDARPVTAPAADRDRDFDRDSDRDTTPTLPTPPRKHQPERFLKSLHLRTPNKRARSPPPAELPSSPPPAIAMHDVGIASTGAPLETTLDGPLTGSTTESDTERLTRRDSMKRARARARGAEKKGLKPVIPTFLTHSESNLMEKFQEITWIERNRLTFGPCVLEHVDLRTGPNDRPDPKRAGMDRYCNIKPWSHNRVKLQVGEDCLNYVNASPIVLESDADPNLPPLRYIAMQGPTRQSLEYVWRMIAEQVASPVVIVQLTNMVEHGTQKCFPYFPQERSEEEGAWKINEGDSWGDGWSAELEFEEATTLAGGAIELTKMRLRVNGEEEGKVVWHFLYTRWPDFGVPAIEDLESFFELMKLSREYGGDGDAPRVVHCSAGVGRTGTFISLEHLMRELEAGYLEGYDGDEEEPDLVFETVDELRRQRRSMVQADTQFLFVYRVLRKLWLDKYREATAGEYEGPATKRLEIGGEREGEGGPFGGPPKEE